MTIQEIITKLREDAHEMESPYYEKMPMQPDWKYLAKAFTEIADDLEAAVKS